MADGKQEKLKSPAKFSDAVSEELIISYRNVVKSYYEKHLYKSAAFWADKIMCITNDPHDIYWNAQCLYHFKEFQRAAHIIISRNLHKSIPQCQYVAAKSLFEAKEYNESLSILEGLEFDYTLAGEKSFQNETAKHFNSVAECVELQSSVLLLKAQVLQANGNRIRASECYRDALLADIRCHESFDALIRLQMLSSVEEQELMERLESQMAAQCSEEEAKMLRLLYRGQLKKYDKPRKVPDSDPKIEVDHSKTADVRYLESSDPRFQLSKSLDCRAWQAERLYYNCDYHQCLDVTNNILKTDPYHPGCLPVHIGCLVQFNKANDLFQLAHRLVKLYPEEAISWYAVGCYYFVIGKSDPARRYLSKATMIDQLFGPAWLAYGHSFASENEHDQAMAAYFRASQLMKGCHLPLLYVGLECGLTNNIELADKFFVQARDIAPCDPYVLHEMGVTSFHDEDYETAKKCFEDALAEIQQSDSRRLEENWEPLFNNLGHVYRKLGKLPEALQLHQQALSLQPLNGSTYAAIGLVQMLMGHLLEAVEAFHEALGLKPEDSFSTTMLGYSMEALTMNPIDGIGQPFEGEPVELPAILRSAHQQASPSDPLMTPQQPTEDISNLSIECEMQDTSP
ncbi:cell division cycle protein 16 homolog isoform X2 [Neocloeon triangulifer]|uniref:cell division cycle protein 16 homolog isoform X2 n=1 Tax=Neocloeon triangulifer TaxID=2078957 RepID=UPI00286F9E5C|nr:cell division cycle protein 16 homolog isoform X2 [Neocloeon triangulifer]